MNDILKAARLDFFLVRQYIKTTLLILLYPMLLVAINKALLNGIAFAMCFVSMTSSYPFTISEKNGVNRLYGILPVSRKHMVLGRYVFISALGLLSLLLQLLICPLILRLRGVETSPVDFFLTALTGLFLFTIFNAFLLPGFYKYGSIKGRLFMLIPAVAFVAVLLLAGFAGFETGPLYRVTLVSPLVLTVAVVLFCVVAYALSISVSIRIYEKKEQNDE